MFVRTTMRSGHLLFIINYYVLIINYYVYYCVLYGRHTLGNGIDPDQARDKWRSFFSVPFAIVYSVGDVTSSYYFDQRGIGLHRIA